MNPQLNLKRAALLFAVLAISLLTHSRASESPAEFPFKTGDRVAWIGSSSTRIGTWCRTMEFLLRTRHPELNLSFSRGTTGGGTFLTGIKNLPVWLSDFKPTVVLYNYGGNDASAGLKGIPQLKLNMQKCVEITQDAGARVLFMTHQSGDVRVTSKAPFDNRKLYAETMLGFAKENNWTMYDTHHPLESLQLDCQKETPDFTLNKDRIHLTDSSYCAWGFYLYERMNPPVVESSVELNADGRIIHETHCTVSNAIVLSPGVIEFTRADSVLPLIPPDPIPTGNALKVLPTSAGAVVGAAAKEAIKDLYKPLALGRFFDAPSAGKPFGDLALPWLVVASAQFSAAPAVPLPKIPPAQVAYAAKFGQQLPARALVPLEKLSRYMLKINGLEPGKYEVSCEGKPIGLASEKELATGVNLNTLLLDSKNPAPWSDLLKNVWIGKRLDEIGTTKWKFRVEKK